MRALRYWIDPKSKWITISIFFHPTHWRPVSSRPTVALSHSILQKLALAGKFSLSNLKRNCNLLERISSYSVQCQCKFQSTLSKHIEMLGIQYISVICKRLAFHKSVCKSWYPIYVHLPPKCFNYAHDKTWQSWQSFYIILNFIYEIEHSKNWFEEHSARKAADGLMIRISHSQLGHFMPFLTGSKGFPRILSLNLHDKPTILGFSYGFPMVFLWFSYCFFFDAPR